MTIVVDPAIRIVGPDSQVFVLHPGEGKRFFRDFIDSSAVFLDLPGIAFAVPPDITDAKTQASLRMARRIAIWRRAGSPGDKVPSRNPADYEQATRNEYPRFIREVEDLYRDAKAGDLVIVPGKGYGKGTLMGEFVRNFDPDFSVETQRYPSEKVAARKVRWFPVDIAKSDFSARMIKMLQNRQAIIRLTRPEDRHEAYEKAYGDYVWGETSGNLVKVTADQVDLYDLSRAADLVNYFASQYLALKQGRLEEFANLTFEVAIERFYDKSYFGGVDVEIHSPGYFGRVMHDAMLAGYVSAMLAISGAGVSAQEATDVIVSNSAQVAVSICDMELEEDIRETMEVYANLALWEEQVCARREKSRATVGLSTDVKVVIVPDGQAPQSAKSAYSEQQGKEAK